MESRFLSVKSSFKYEQFGIKGRGGAPSLPLEEVLRFVFSVQLPQDLKNFLLAV